MTAVLQFYARRNLKSFQIADEHSSFERRRRRVIFPEVHVNCAVVARDDHNLNWPLARFDIGATFSCAEGKQVKALNGKLFGLERRFAAGTVKGALPNRE